jgi:hypothetical protein
LLSDSHNLRKKGGENIMADNNTIQPEALVEQLRALRQQIPQYTSLTVANAKSLRTAAAVHPGFVSASINAVGASPVVAIAVGSTPDVLRQEQSDVVRWTAVEDELRAMLKGVLETNLTRRHRLGLTALQAYSFSRTLVRKPEHADLLAHVTEMKRFNRFGRGRTKPVDPLKKAPVATPPVTA